MATDSARLQQLIRRHVGMACVLVDVTTGQISEVSARTARLVGMRRDELRGEAITTIAAQLWRSEPVRLLLAGTLGIFTASTSLRRSDGRTVPVSVWARLVDTSSGRWVVLAFSPPARRGLPEALVSTPPQVPVAIGMCDGAGTIAMVSDDVESILGQTAEHMTAHPVTGFLHTDDLTDYLLASTDVAVTGQSQALRIRLRGGDGSWRPVRLVITRVRMGPDDDRSAFAITADTPGSPDAQKVERLHDLEERLRRIAAEVAAMTDGPAPAPADVDRLEDLPPRQQEIVRRLLQGARVPTIAQELFLSQSTVRNHLSAMFRKFGVASQEELVQRFRG